MAMPIWSESILSAERKGNPGRPKLVVAARESAPASPRLLEPRAFASYCEASVDWSAVRRQQRQP